MLILPTRLGEDPVYCVKYTVHGTPLKDVTLVNRIRCYASGIAPELARCPLRMDICDKVEPVLEDRGGHMAACHLYN